MIFINYRRPNIYKEIIERFSDLNRYMSFGVVKAFVTEKLKWVATMLFKHRNNLQTNKHKTLIGFYSDKEMFINEFANADSLSSIHIFAEPHQISDINYELASRQYSKVGVEYTEYDQVEYIDASDQIVEPIDYELENFRSISHKYGDAPVFIAAGYQIPIDDTGNNLVYVFDPGHDGSQVNFNGFEVYMADYHKDPYTNKYMKDYFDQTVVDTIISGEYISADLVSQSPTISGVGTWTVAP